MVFKMKRSFGKLAPAVIADALDELYQAQGEVTPTAVVDMARPEDAVLHPAFEWDDEVAAEEYRLWQARNMVRCLVVVNDNTAEETPQYVHVRVANQDEGRYLPASVVVADVDLWARAVSELQGKANALLGAIAALESMARDSGDSDRMMRVSLAVRALETANSALAAIH